MCYIEGKQTSKSESKAAMNLTSFSVEDLLRKRKRLRRELLEAPNLQPLKIAVLGGSTTNEVVDLLDLLLLADGFVPNFYQSEYNKYYEDAVLAPEHLKAFAPDIVYIHTHNKNIQNFPAVSATEADLADYVASELARFQAIWSSLHESIGCQVIQNNFEHPALPLLGNFDSVAPGGQTRFINALNMEFAKASHANRRLIIQDLNTLAADLGLSRWFDWSRWHSYKLATTPEGSLAIAKSLASMIGVMSGRVKKCLVLDLDNTLWGGVIGDDGLDNIQIGNETAVAEAHTAFQKYCLAMRERGVLLAVCSKNNDDVAKSGFTHPDSVLKLEHFSAFKANWEPKHENIQAIAQELNLGLDSFVFIDDNPAERAIVSAQLPMVSVPDVGSEVALFPSIIQAGRYFEVVSLSSEDLERASAYAANAKRASLEHKFANYGEYLDSLEMEAEIDEFRSIYLERITQLINKSNQFNLTTRRYTFAEIEEIAGSDRHVAIYGRLTDRFGDNGLISVIIGRMDDSHDLHLDLWIMSCRVLKRDMELAMLDALVERARDAGAAHIIGYYLPTSKNSMVANHYAGLGFSRGESADEGSEDSKSTWTLDVASYIPRNTHIQVRALVYG
jgi:FkbH-like protein